MNNKGCDHSRYMNPSYMTVDRVRDITTGRKNNIAWYSAIIVRCQDCGADISSERIVKTKTAKEFLAEFGIVGDTKKTDLRR